MDGGNRGPGAWLLTGLHHTAAHQAFVEVKRARVAGSAHGWRATCMERADSGLQRLAAACTNANVSAEGGGMAVMTGVGSEVSRKRRRAAQANSVSTQAASVEEHLAALRARWQVCCAAVPCAGAAGSALC